MNANPLISVIIPVYNVELYLERCIDSILKQSYDDLEIILINDGSNDSCPRLCDEYAEKDPRAKVIHKQNEGVSVARNIGIRIAKGAFLSFVDADDHLSTDFYKIMYTCLYKTNADIVMCDYLITKDGGHPVKQEPKTRQKIYHGHKEIMKLFFGRDSTKAVISCNKLYKKELFNGIEFPKGWRYEDEATIYKVLYRCDRLAEISNKLYYYYQREESFTNRKISVDNLVLFTILDQVVQFYQSKGEQALERDAKVRYFKMIKIFQYKIRCQGGKTDLAVKKRLEDLYESKLKQYGMGYYKYHFEIYGFLKRFMIH